MKKLNVYDIISKSEDTTIQIVLTPGLHANTRAEKALYNLKAQEVHVNLVWLDMYGWIISAALFDGEDETIVIPEQYLEDDVSFEWRLNRILKGALPTMKIEWHDFLPPWMQKEEEGEAAFTD